MLEKHSVSIKGHRTSFSLENEFWQEFRALAKEQSIPVARLVSLIDEARQPDQNLSSSIRLYVLEKLQQKAAGGGVTGARGIPRHS